MALSLSKTPKPERGLTHSHARHGVYSDYPRKVRNGLTWPHGIPQVHSCIHLLKAQFLSRKRKPAAELSF